MQNTTPAKPVIFLSGEIKTPPFGASARQDAGNALRRLQEGDSLSLPLSRKDSDMKTEKRKQLEKAGYAVFDDARDWLGFTEEEKILSDMQIAAARELERLRAEQGVSQTELARRMGTKQSTVSRTLRSPQTASFDWLFRALIALGATPRKIAACLA